MKPIGKKWPQQGINPGRDWMCSFFRKYVEGAFVGRQHKVTAREQGPWGLQGECQDGGHWCAGALMRVRVAMGEGASFHISVSGVGGVTQRAVVLLYFKKW